MGLTPPSAAAPWVQGLHPLFRRVLGVCCWLRISQAMLAPSHAALQGLIRWASRMLGHNGMGVPGPWGIWALCIWGRPARARVHQLPDENGSPQRRPPPASGEQVPCHLQSSAGCSQGARDMHISRSLAVAQLVLLLGRMPAAQLQHLRCSVRAGSNAALSLSSPAV